MSFLTNLTRNEKLITLFTVITIFFHLLGTSGNLGKTINFFNLLDLDLGILFAIDAIGFLLLLIGGYFLDLDFNIQSLIPFRTSSMTDTDILDIPFDLTDVLRLLLPIWTVGTIIGWLLYHHVTVGGTFLDPQVYLDPSLITKVVEVLIIVFWFLDYLEVKKQSKKDKE